jgi:hypothetical protein
MLGQLVSIERLLTQRRIPIVADDVLPGTIPPLCATNDRDPRTADPPDSGPGRSSLPKRKRFRLEQRDIVATRESEGKMSSRFLLAMTVAGAIVSPALGQTPATGLSGGAAQSTAPIPDLSGVWLHPGLGFGPPLSGPGPVRNKSRLPSGASNFALVVGDYTNPILKPEAAEVVKKFGDISLSGKVFPDPDNMCLQNPLPYLFWNFSVQILQQPDKVALIYAHDNDYPMCG